MNRKFAIAALCLLVVACSRKRDAAADFERVTLPGFSIELPRGEVTLTSTAASAGKHEVKLPKPSFMDVVTQRAVNAPKLSVEWMAQSFSREEWDQQMVPIFTQALAREIPGAKVLRQESLAADRWLHVIGLPTSPVAFGIVSCDQAFSVLVVHGRFRQPDLEAAEVRRILRSVTCNVTDANRARVEAAVRLPPGFGRTSDPQLQMYRSLNGEQLTTSFASGDAQRDAGIYHHLILSLLSTSLGKQLNDSQLVQLDSAVQGAEGKRSLARVEFPDTQERIYVGTTYCADRNLTLISFWFSARRDDALARERQSQTGCPGGTSTPLPRFEAMVEQACKAGDQRACGMRASPGD
jgi:hypothetical protein